MALTLERSAPGTACDLIADIVAGRCLGRVVNGALDPTEAGALSDVFLRGRVIAPVPSSHWSGRVYGPSLVVADAALGGYFEGAAQIAGADMGGRSLVSLIASLIAPLAGGRPVKLPLHTSGQPYAPGNARALSPGGAIALHCENETIGFAAMAHLSTLIDTRSQISFFVTLSLPETGGQLQIYGLRHGEGAGAELETREREGAELETWLAGQPVVEPPLRVGDLIVFDAGRHYHRVTTVQGERPRVTLGGFGALARDGSCVYCWG